MTRATVYLHIGMNKTGTSALQRFFARNQVSLARFGILYPITGQVGEAHFELSHVLGFGGRPNEQSKAYRALSIWNGLLNVRPGSHSFGLGVMARRLATRSFHLAKSTHANPGNSLDSLRKMFHAEVAESGLPAVLCSSESFVKHGDVEAVRAFFEPLSVRIVVYLRRHDFWWTSGYGQALKMVPSPPWEMGIDGYLEYMCRRRVYVGRYLELLQRWSAVFGDDALIVRPYERQQNQPDIVSDFLRAIGRQDVSEKLDTEMGEVNKGISARGLMLMEVFRRTEVEKNVRDRLLRYAMAQVEGEDGLSLLSPVNRRALIHENAHDYEQIARRYLGRADGRLFHDEEPDLNEHWVPPSLSDAELVQETLNALRKGQTDISGC